MERRLTAILSADVKGYSRLMGEDEEATIRTLTSYRQVMETLIPLHRGRVVDSPGDNLLAEFSSVVDAVQCAVVIQTTLRAENANLPQHRRMEFRIGINLGDVMMEGERIYGDGVNIAARVEGLAEAGGICISGTVFDHIKGKVSVNFEDLGLQQVKNIAEPVRVYHVVPASAERQESKDDSGTDKDVVLAVKPSIAVLAFENMSNDPEQAYFSDGISEDVITDLSKISGLFVIARNSSFQYRGQAVSATQISQELRVRYVVEGSVRKSGNRVRVTSQLIDGTTGGHVWAERYDRDLTDIFEVQDEITQQIVAALTVKLTPEDRERLDHKGTDNLEAYDHFLRGRDLAWRMTKEAYGAAKVELEQAIMLDPNFAPAHAMLSHTHNLDYANQWSTAPRQSLERAHELAHKAVAVDQSNPYGHWVLGITYGQMKLYDQAISEAETALALDPNFAPAHITLGGSRLAQGSPQQALELFEKGMRLDPHSRPIVLQFMARAYYMLGRYDDAAATLNQRLVYNPDSDISHALLAATLGQLGRVEEARAAWAKTFKVNPEYSLEHRRELLSAAEYERMLDGLRKAGLPE